MKKVVVVGAALALLAGASGCSSTKSAEGEPAKEPAKQSEKAAKKPAQSIPASSPLSKVSMGMKRGQVEDILGRPTSTRNFPSGKAFNPFYYGPDTVRTGAFYKGVGRVVFSGADIVVEITYDPAEDGY